MGPQLSADDPSDAIAEVIARIDEALDNRLVVLESSMDVLYEDLYLGLEIAWRNVLA